MAIPSPYSDDDLREKRLNFLVENKPDWYELLVSEDRLEEHLQSRVDACREEAERLFAQGYEAQAWSWAVRTEILDQERD